MGADLLRGGLVTWLHVLLIAGLSVIGIVRPVSAAGVIESSGSPVWALPADGQFYLGKIDLVDHDPLGRDGFAIQGGRHIIYLVDVEPGESYTFGLRMPNLGKPTLDVMAFDRWPYDDKAKAQHLATGGTLMSHQDYIEYQWHLGVSPKSPGNLLYLVVELKKPHNAEYRRFPVRAFMAHPPIDPMRSRGRGVTYARGPANLMLQERDNRVRVVQLAQPEPEWRLDQSRVAPPEIGLLQNGHFQDGLRSWNILTTAHNEKELGVSVGDQGLRLWATVLDQRAGIEQTLAPQGVSGQKVRLSLELRIDRQTQQDKFQTLDDFPLRLDLICQPAGRNADERPQQWSRAFSVVRPEMSSPLRSTVVQVPAKAWYRYETDLPDGLTQNCNLSSVRLSGGGFPEREVKVRKVQIVGE